MRCARKHRIGVVCVCVSRSQGELGGFLSALPFDPQFGCFNIGNSDYGLRFPFAVQA